MRGPAYCLIMCGRSWPGERSLDTSVLTHAGNLLVSQLLFAPSGQILQPHICCFAKKKPDWWFLCSFCHVCSMNTKHLDQVHLKSTSVLVLMKPPLSFSALPLYQYVVCILPSVRLNFAIVKDCVLITVLCNTQIFLQTCCASCFVFVFLLLKCVFFLTREIL